MYLLVYIDTGDRLILRFSSLHIHKIVINDIGAKEEIFLDEHEMLM